MKFWYKHHAGINWHSFEDPRNNARLMEWYFHAKHGGYDTILEEV